MLELLQSTFQEGEVWSPTIDPEGKADIEAMGFRTQAVEMNDPFNKSRIVELGPRVVVFDRFVMEEQFGSYVRMAAPQALMVLDLQDLHSLRRLRKLVHQKEQRSTNLVAQCGESQFFDIDFESPEDRLREFASMLRVDQVWTLSLYEFELLQNGPLDFRSLSYYPLAMYGRRPRVDSQAASENLKTREKTSAVFFGNYRHEPNLEAAWQLLDHIWPEVLKRYPEAKLSFFGAYMPEALSQKIRAAQKNGLPVQSLGWAKDVSLALLSHDVVLAPLAFGAGIKGKVLEGLREGLPVVGTSVAWEGIIPGYQLNQISKDTLQAFAEETVALFRSKELRNETWQQQNALVHETHGPKVLAESERLVMERMLQAMESKKKSTWIQSILRHDTVDRLKYFAKYLELKTRNLK